MSNCSTQLLKVWEREVIYKHYPIGGYRACQLHGVDRTQASIQSHAKRLGLTEDRRQLTAQEKTIISTVYPLGGIPLIREKTDLLDRHSASTVRRWANNQGHKVGDKDDR